MTDAPRHESFSLASSDPEGRLVDRGGLGPAELAQVDAIMEQMGRLRAAERAIAAASQRYMRLGETDMRAIRFLISAKNTGGTVTPGALARHLGITTASITKLLDRLEAGGHVVRSPHPTDRRSQRIEVTAETHLVAREQVGRHHAVRFGAAARLTPAERDVVIRYLRESADDLSASLGAAEPGA
ncbi:MarR family winged helix-turn-helix transcriptional regulator [Zafaria sp. Z1313]|uniref:MarR family winged helix-turn-helix transcriptional regulator n=1 Tax=unclassified Zafaria TaxID=2828765 RepID=UPI002E78B601|nr:MarR family transcriptional regulator [Zafaria sp. J156]MEE1620939.1 MarR family transcriptional regulator [Zafaria sp. J156]